MTRLEAENYFKTRILKFMLEPGDNHVELCEPQFIDCTTEMAKTWADALATMGSTINVIGDDGDFRGWEIEDIMENNPSGIEF